MPGSENKTKYYVCICGADSIFDAGGHKHGNSKLKR